MDRVRVTTIGEKSNSVYANDWRTTVLSTRLNTKRVQLQVMAVTDFVGSLRLTNICINNFFLISIADYLHYNPTKTNNVEQKHLLIASAVSHCHLAISHSQQG